MTFFPECSAARISGTLSHLPAEASRCCAWPSPALLRGTVETKPNSESGKMRMVELASASLKLEIQQALVSPSRAIKDPLWHDISSEIKRDFSPEFKSQEQRNGCTSSCRTVMVHKWKSLRGPSAIYLNICKWCPFIKNDRDSWRFEAFLAEISQVVKPSQKLFGVWERSSIGETGDRPALACFGEPTI